MNENINETKAESINEIPKNLSAALARNIPAMRVFASLDDGRRRGIIEGARSLTSKKELRGYVKNIKTEK